MATEVPEIEPATYAGWRGMTGVRLIDVREPWEQAICALPEGESVPMADLPAVAADLAASSATLVVMCHHGVRSARAAMYLCATGCRDVVNLAGGIDAWARLIEPGMARY